MAGCNKGYGGKWKIPIRDEVEDSERWLGTSATEQPILIYWDALVREITGTNKNTERNCIVSEEERDRLRWAWLTFGRKGQPYVDQRDHWRFTTGLCPFFECTDSSRTFDDLERFARHLVEMHCRECPRYYCCDDPHGPTARCTSSSQGVITPYFTSRRGQMVDHLKKTHKLQTEKAIRRTEILLSC